MASAAPNWPQKLSRPSLRAPLTARTPPRMGTPATPPSRRPERPSIHGPHHTYDDGENGAFLCRQAGIIQAGSLDEMAYIIAALRRLAPVQGRRVAILGGAGGGSVTMTDQAEQE